MSTKNIQVTVSNVKIGAAKVTNAYKKSLRRPTQLHSFFRNDTLAMLTAFIISNPTVSFILNFENQLHTTYKNERKNVDSWRHRKGFKNTYIFCALWIPSVFRAPNARKLFLLLPQTIACNSKKILSLNGGNNHVLGRRREGNDALNYLCEVTIGKTSLTWSYVHPA